jgi:hypothetical protein
MSSEATESVNIEGAVEEASQELVSKLVAMVKNDEGFLSLLKTTIGRMVNERLVSITEKQDKMQEEQEKLHGEIHTLTLCVEKLRHDVSVLENDRSKLYEREYWNKVNIVDLQQYTRRNCLLITGIPESTERDSEGNFIKEDTDKRIMDLAKDKLGIVVKEEDIDRTHRATRTMRGDGKPRAIIAKFSRFNIRDKIIKARTDLKGTHIGIQELLCKEKQELLEKARELASNVPRVKSAWSWDGNIFILIQSGKPRKHIMRSMWDIQNIIRLYGELPAE